MIAKTPNSTYRLNVQVTAYGRQTVLIGVWSGHMTHYKNLGAPVISLERLNLKVVKFCTRVGNINSMQQDDVTYHQHKGVVMVTWLFLNFVVCHDAARCTVLSATAELLMYLANYIQADRLLRQQLSYGDCLQGKRGDYLTSSVLLCIVIVHIICTPI